MFEELPLRPPWRRIRCALNACHNFGMIDICIHRLHPVGDGSDMKGVEEV